MYRFTFLLAALFLPLVAVAGEIDPGSAEPPRETQLVYKGGKGHGHQGVATNGKQWFVMHTDQIFRYESPDFSVDQSTLVRNMEPFSHPDFKGTSIDHLGAPACHDGKVYTFAKTYKAYKEGKCEYKVWLVWYAQDDLRYMGHVSVKPPPCQAGGLWNESGGPVIRGQDVYTCVYQFDPEDPGKRRPPSDRLGVFDLHTGEFRRFVHLKGKTYSRPQGVYIDSEGGYCIAETCGGIKRFDSSAQFDRHLFRSGKWDVHEGLVYDLKSHRLTFALTRYRKDLGGHKEYIVQVDLGKDRYRYVDGEKGDRRNDGYTPSTPKRFVARRYCEVEGKRVHDVSGMEATLPGQTLLVSGYTKTNPLRETIHACYDGTAELPITVMGHPDPLYVTGANDVSETAEGCRWSPSRSGKEYFLTTDDGKAAVETAVRVLAMATKAAWEEDGLDGVAKRAKGSIGRLNPGEWGWGDNDKLGFATLYYRPAEGEDIKTVHIEAGQREDAVVLQKAHNTCKHVKVYLLNREP